MSRYSRILGGLIGGAWGDAMGMPSEMWSRSRIRDYFGEIKGFLPGPPENEISKGFAAGETTDDTAHTVMVAQMLAETGGAVEPMDYIRRLKIWMEQSEKSKSVTGPSTSRAVVLIEQGVSVEQTGRSGVTNGAVMKIAPVGMTGNPQNLEALVERVHLLCMPTHNTTTAISGASAVAAAFACAVEGEKDWGRLWETAMRAAALGEQKGYYVAAASVSARMRLAKRLVDQSASAEAALEEIYLTIGTGLPVNESVPAVFAAAYLAQGNPMLCARFCANLGGDTDTIGAVACGLCGALSGAETFAPEDVRLLEQVNGLDFAQLANGLAPLS